MAPRLSSRSREEPRTDGKQDDRLPARFFLEPKSAGKRSNGAPQNTLNSSRTPRRIQAGAENRSGNAGNPLHHGPSVERLRSRRERREALDPVPAPARIQTAGYW